MSRPRVLVLSSTWPAVPEDGTPAFVRDLAVEEGAPFEVLALVPRVPGSADEEEDGPIRVSRYRYFPERWEDLADGAILENLRRRPSRWIQLPFLILGQLLATSRAVRTFRPDVLHVHWIIPQGIVARLVAPRIPKIVTSPGGDIYALDSGPMRRVKRWVLRNADRVTVMNADMQARAIALGTDADRVSVVPMGTKLLHPSPRRPHLDDDVVRIFFIGRLVEKKGVHVLLRALRELGATSPWKLEIGGDGPLRADLEAQAEGLPVSFLGQLDRTSLTAAFERADLVVFPSVLAGSGDQDGLPVALLDALAAGSVIVASDLPGLNEAVVDGVSGLLVPSGEVGALASTVRAVLEDAGLRERLSRGSTLRAAEYSIEAAGSRYTELLQAVLAKRVADDVQSP